jgi:hypothetical protein
MVASDGNWRAGEYGALSGAAMGYLGTEFKGGGWSTTLEKGALEGVANGTLMAAYGGSFEDGFIGAFVGAIGERGLPANNGAEFMGRMTVLATLSGTMARLNGGSFANAAWSTVFQQLFNAGMHVATRGNTLRIWRKGEVMVTQAEARKILTAIFGKAPKNITLEDRAFAQSLAINGIQATKAMGWLERGVSSLFSNSASILLEGSGLVGLSGNAEWIKTQYEIGRSAAETLIKQRQTLYQELQHVQINGSVLDTLRGNFHGEYYLRIHGLGYPQNFINNGG